MRKYRYIKDRGEASDRHGVIVVILLFTPVDGLLEHLAPRFASQKFSSNFRADAVVNLNSKQIDQSRLLIRREILLVSVGRSDCQQEMKKGMLSGH